MRFNKQMFKHRPQDGIPGDCHRACLTSMLDLEIGDIPNVPMELALNGTAFHQFYDDELHKLGYAAVTFAYEGDLSGVQNIMQVLNPGVRYILGGSSARGIGHSVVGCGNKVLWDPSTECKPAEEPIVGPLDGYYWVSFLVPNTQTTFYP